jgi:hypothetical protein
MFLVMKNMLLLMLVALPMMLLTGNSDLNTYGGAMFWVGFVMLLTVIVAPNLGKARRAFLTTPMGEGGDYPAFLQRLHEKEPVDIALAEAFHWTTASLLVMVIGFVFVLLST